MRDPALPDWLPDLIPFDWNAIEATIERAYGIFVRDFFDPKTSLSFRGRRLAIKRHPEFDGKSATFWHLVTAGDDEASRAPDRERLERIAWPRAMIIEAESGSSRVRLWKNQRKRRGHARSARWVIALPDFSYVVVLDDRGNYVLLWTAYTVREEHHGRKLRREHDAWVASQKG